VGTPTTAGRAGVLLADRDATITQLVPAAASADTYRRDLAALATG
jgi:hypothetical protein